jgi:hypothetical protein
MGAAHKFDLTSDVTHLLVGEINTAKYKFVARERSDVVVLRPEWVEAVRQSWMQGEDTDIRALEQQYRLPTFMGLAICITGFEDSMKLVPVLPSADKANGHCQWLIEITFRILLSRMALTLGKTLRRV